MTSNLLDRLAAQPLFQCSFRPLFLGAAVYAVVAMAWWLAFLGMGMPLPAVPGGPLVWHAHEMIFGFGFAAVAGFVLTAIPEFTGTATFRARVALHFALLWLLGRVLFWMSGMLGVLPAALVHGLLVLLLVGMVLPRVLRDPERRHLDFVWGLAAFALTVLGFYYDVLSGHYPMRWLYAAIGVMMVLIIVAMSRVSMRIVNDALDVVRERSAPDVGLYYSRAPRRGLAVFAVALYTVAEFFAPHSAVTGWLGLVVAAAMFNLLNDWHVGRALFARWVLLAYLMYWLIALGYAALGVTVLWGGLPASAGRHLLTIGGMGISIFAVFGIAGRIHAGYAVDTRPWVMWAGGLLIVAALLRAALALVPDEAQMLLVLSGLGWIAAFGLVCALLGVLWLRPRVDGGQGCEEVRGGVVVR